VNPTEELHTCQCWRLAGAEMTFEHAAESSWGQYISARHYSGVNFMTASQIQALGSQMQNSHHAKTSRCKRTWKWQQNPWRDGDGDKCRAGLVPEQVRLGFRRLIPGPMLLLLEPRLSKGKRLSFSTTAGDWCTNTGNSLACNMIAVSLFLRWHHMAAA
jgi:hypothetical protein